AARLTRALACAVYLLDSVVLRCSGVTGAVPSFPTRRSSDLEVAHAHVQEALGVVRAADLGAGRNAFGQAGLEHFLLGQRHSAPRDPKSTRLNSSHVEISYAVLCFKKKKGDRARPPSGDSAND